MRLLYTKASPPKQRQPPTEKKQGLSSGGREGCAEDRLGLYRSPSLDGGRPGREAERPAALAVAWLRQGHDAAADGGETGLGLKSHGSAGSVLGRGLAAVEQHFPGGEIVAVGLGRARLAEEGPIAPDAMHLGIVELAGGQHRETLADRR